ncbi:MAG TPA: hypothetical protein VG844_16880 [Terracidiphilus sp.]|nr:hypothetical protein [Terracidiphilus sp.]
MARTLKKLSFQQQLDALKTNGFAVSASNAAPGAQLVSKNGTAAVLVAGADGSAAYAVHPGTLVKGEVARLVDRGYQKFLTTPHVELPATASQLHAIHTFHEELTQCIGGVSLYNESLGTTSDMYLYDRLKGREEEQHRSSRPWELASGH